MTIRVFAIIALSAVGACLAQGQALGYAFAITDATYTGSAPGFYFTYTSQITYSSISSSEGTNWTDYDYYYGYTPDVEEAEAYGQSTSAPQIGEAAYVEELNTTNWVTITNESKYADTLTVEVSTEDYVDSYAASQDDWGFGRGVAEFSDTDGFITQSSDALANDDGLQGVGNYYYASNYDPYNGETSTSYNYGYSYPFSVYAYAYDTQYYYLTFAPGSSDTFYVSATESHGAYTLATTPGPEAIAPFAVGLIAALRRRKKG